MKSKKIFYFLAIAAITFTSCQDKNVPENKTESDAFTFKASIESLETKGNPAPAGESSDMARATINASHQLLWWDNGKAGGDRVADQIGIFANGSNESFTLSSGYAGQISGEFTRDASGDYNPADATVAFFPWQGTGSDKNNVNSGTMYFKLPDDYWGYYNGQMLTPLIASISNSNNIQFKHAGAAVKFTVNDLPSGSYKTWLTVANEQITGNFHVNPAHAGDDKEADSKLTLDAAKDASKNHIMIAAWKSSGAFSWIFPVPALTEPKLTFTIKDYNGVTLWTKSPKKQSSIGRGDILVMNPLDVSPYSNLVEDDSWVFCGNVNGSEEIDNVPLYTDGEYSVLSGCTFAVNDEFKIHAKVGEAAYPEGDKKKITAAGTKDIIFNRTSKEISIVDHSYPYPAVDITLYVSTSSITIDGNMSDWTGYSPLTSTGTSRIRSWKYATSTDGNTLFFYFVLRKNRMSASEALSIGFDYKEGGYSADNHTDNMVGYDTYIEFNPFTNESQGTPVCNNVTVATAYINGSEQSDLTIKAYGADPNPHEGTVGDSEDYYLEVSIPRSILTGLPDKGTTIKMGAGCENYNTGYQTVTL